MRAPNSGMKKGYKYNKKKKWYNNGIEETQIFADDPVPSGFVPGRISNKGKPTWNTGLTKETSAAVTKISESRKQSIGQPRKYTDEYLITNFIENGAFLAAYQLHNIRDVMSLLHLDLPQIHRCIELGGYETVEEHRTSRRQLTYTDEWRKEHGKKLAGKAAWNAGKKLSNEHIEHMREAQRNRTAKQIIDSKLKEHNTRKINGSYKKHKTKAELKVEQVLLEFFQPSDICYQYFESDRYPFACDYYLRPLDLFIEVNIYPSHGGKPFENSQEDLLKVAEWEKKANVENKKQYANWIYTWTDLDCRKLACARRNSLQYLMIYDLNNLHLLRHIILAKLAKLNSIQIDKIEKITYEVPLPVYDITVTKNNNFIVADGLVVHNCEPYYYLKSALYDQRIKVYKKCDLLTEELVNLERTSTGKIDHPPKGSKDQADAVCGSLYMASKFAQEYAYSYGESLNAALDVNMLNSGDVTKQQMIDSFRQELAGIYSEIQDNDYRRSKAERDEYQDYQDILNGIIAL